jgi:hypothetical protein
VERSRTRKLNSVTEEKNEDLTTKVDELIILSKANLKLMPLLMLRSGK